MCYIGPATTAIKNIKPRESVMIRAIAAAVIVMLATTTAPSVAFSKDEKSPNECGKYLSEMSQDLDTLEALVP